MLVNIKINIYKEIPFYKEQLEQMTYYLLTLLSEKSKYLTEIYSLNNKLNSYLERNNINVSDDPCNVKPTKVVKAEEAFTNVSTSSIDKVLNIFIVLSLVVLLIVGYFYYNRNMNNDSIMELTDTPHIDYEVDYDYCK